jgi:hypothetical protein
MASGEEHDVVEQGVEADEAEHNGASQPSAALGRDSKKIGQAEN